MVKATSHPGNHSFRVRINCKDFWLESEPQYGGVTTLEPVTETALTFNSVLTFVLRVLWKGGGGGGV